MSLHPTPKRGPRSFAGFSDPLHRLTAAQQQAEVAARTMGDSQRASLEAAWDFQLDRDAAADPGSQTAFDRQVGQAIAGKDLRGSLGTVWGHARRPRGGRQLSCGLAIGD